MERMEKKELLMKQREQEYLRNSSLKNMIKYQQKELEDKKKRDLVLILFLFDRYRLRKKREHALK